jgi:hypothetical protein
MMDPRAQEILERATDIQRRYVVQRLDPQCTDIAKAARALKIHTSTPHHWDNLEELEEAVVLLQMDIVDAARLSLQELALDAVGALKRALNGRSAVSAAKTILDRIGLPAQTNVDVTSNGETIKATIYIPDNGRD